MGESVYLLSTYQIRQTLYHIHDRHNATTSNQPHITERRTMINATTNNNKQYNPNNNQYNIVENHNQYNNMCI